MQNLHLKQTVITLSCLSCCQYIQHWEGAGHHIQSMWKSIKIRLQTLVKPQRLLCKHSNATETQCMEAVAIALGPLHTANQNEGVNISTFAVSWNILHNGNAFRYPLRQLFNAMHDSEMQTNQMQWALIQRRAGVEKFRSNLKPRNQTLKLCRWPCVNVVIAFNKTANRLFVPQFWWFSVASAVFHFFLFVTSYTMKNPEVLVIMAWSTLQNLLDIYVQFEWVIHSRHVCCRLPNRGSER